MLTRDHPALGAFRRRYFPRWEPIADDLAQGLRRRMEHDADGCRCQDHLALKVYDEAKWRSRYG